MLASVSNLLAKAAYKIRYQHCSHKFMSSESVAFINNIPLN